MLSLFDTIVMEEIISDGSTSDTFNLPKFTDKLVNTQTAEYY